MEKKDFMVFKEIEITRLSSDWWVLSVKGDEGIENDPEDFSLEDRDGDNAINQVRDVFVRKEGWINESCYEYVKMELPQWHQGEDLQ